MRHLITGAAGFIGSQLADALLAEGETVAGVDDFYLGKPAHLAAASANPRFSFVEADVSDVATRDRRVPQAGRRCAARHRLAPGGQQRHRRRRRRPLDRLPPHLADHLRDHRGGQGDRRARHRLRLDFGRLRRERRSCSTEDTGPLLPISNYGAAKLASEALLSAAAESSLDRLWIFRFPNVIGPRGHPRRAASTSPAAWPAARPRCGCWATGRRPSPTCTSPS